MARWSDQFFGPTGFTPMLDFLPTLSKETLSDNLAWLAPGGYDSASGNIVLCSPDEGPSR